MIELKTTFKKWNQEVTFQQKYKNPNNGVVIYQCNNAWYEIFRYRLCKPDKFHETEYERYPADNDFGSWAWTVPNKDGIRRILNEKFDLDDNSISNIVNSL